MGNNVKIAFDLDDVLIDMIPVWLDTINSRFGTNKKAENIKSWSITNFFKNEIEKGILTKEDIYAPLYEDDFWKHVKPIDGMHDMLLVLKKLGFNMYISTASNYKTIKSKLDNCVMKYYGDIFNNDNIILVKDKSLINADIMVDDYFGNINNFLKANSGKIGIIKNTPHSDIDYDALENTHLSENSHLTYVYEYTTSHDLLATILTATHYILKRK